MQQHGGNNVGDDQVLLLTREIAGIGANVTTLLESFKEFKQELTTNYSTKAETKAMKEAYERELQAMKEAHEKEMKSLRDDFDDLQTTIETEKKNRKEAPHRLVTYLLMVLAGIPGVVALWQHH